MPGMDINSANRLKLKNEIQQAFKMYGFQLRIDACKHLEGLLIALHSSEWREWIDKVLDVLQKKSDLESSMVDKDILDKVIQVSSYSKFFFSKSDPKEIFCYNNYFSNPRIKLTYLKLHQFSAVNLRFQEIPA